MKAPTIKVSLTYLGHFNTTDSEDYRVTKIVGAPTVGIVAKSGQGSILPKPAHVGDLITEAQATELAGRVEVTTVGRA